MKNISLVLFGALLILMFAPGECHAASRASRIQEVLKSLPKHDDIILTDPVFNNVRRDLITAVVIFQSPSVKSFDPENSTVTLLDKVVVRLLNHDTGQQDDYVVRNNIVTYRIDTAGTMTQSNVVVSKNDIRRLARTFHVYNIATESPMSEESLSAFFEQLLPPALPSVITISPYIHDQEPICN